MPIRTQKLVSREIYEVIVDTSGSPPQPPTLAAHTKTPLDSPCRNKTQVHATDETRRLMNRHIQYTDPTGKDLLSFNAPSWTHVHRVSTQVCSTLQANQIWRSRRSTMRLASPCKENRASCKESRVDPFVFIMRLRKRMNEDFSRAFVNISATI
jgi:hypothetical protein